MNNTTVNTKTQSEIVNSTLNANQDTAGEKITRAGRRRKKRELSKASQVASSMQTQHKEEVIKLGQEIINDLKAHTWRDLETKGRFTKNDKLSFIKEDMLILGCDIGCETHYIRAIDFRGVELGKKAFAFSNSEEGFHSAKAWAVDIAARSHKTQMVLGLEPTGHYWFCLASWFVSNGISVVQVNPYAVKQTKELEDNSQSKDDRKDPKLIANLVKDGNYGMPYLPEGIYADLRKLSLFKDQLSEDRTRCVNRLHREMKIYFPEYTELYDNIAAPFSLKLLKEAPFPNDIMSKGAGGIREIWKQSKMKGRGYGKAAKIVSQAETSVGIKDGQALGRDAVKWFVERIEELDGKLEEIVLELQERCKQIPHAQNILGIGGIGDNILAGILSEIGDINRFDDAKELQKLSGLGLVACSSGKHKGETKISHRGRKRLRYWLFQGAKSVVVHAVEFKQMHAYYTTRFQNPLKKMQSLMAIACKLLRIIFTILKKGVKYNPERMMEDIIFPMAKGTPQKTAA